MTQAEFKKKCARAAASADVELFDEFYDEAPGKIDAFEDDGTLHVVRAGLRACFDVGAPDQDATPEVQNRRTQEVLTALGMKKFITDRVFIEPAVEDDDGGGYCSHCGRS